MDADALRFRLLSVPGNVDAIEALHAVAPEVLTGMVSSHRTGATAAKVEQRRLAREQRKRRAGQRAATVNASADTKQPPKRAKSPAKKGTARKR
jgi:hypothetical protein